jgi:hypothetical protein
MDRVQKMMMQSTHVSGIVSDIVIFIVTLIVIVIVTLIVIVIRIVLSSFITKHCS